MRAWGHARSDCSKRRSFSKRSKSSKRREDKQLDREKRRKSLMGWKDGVEARQKGPPTTPRQDRSQGREKGLSQQELSAIAARER